MTPLRRGRAVVLAAIAGIAVAGSAAGAAPRAGAAGADGCSAGASAPANRWSKVRLPDAAARSVQQLDQDPCALLAATPAGRRWRSRDGGRTWAEIAATPATARVLTERLQPRAGRDPVGPLVGVGPAPAGATDLPEVYVSDDDGATFRPAELDARVDTPVGPVGSPGPLRLDVTAAATAVHYDRGLPKPYVYLAGRAAGTTLAGMTLSAADTLVKSVDGGHTFRPVEGARGLTPSVIAINPTTSDEVWVNDVRAGTAGGGAWMSYDGGATFTSVCCPNATVRDIEITRGASGGIVVVLATDEGVKRSVDDGASWEPVTTTPATGVRTPPDDPATLVVQSGSGVTVTTGATGVAKPVPGLPSDCAPTGLRRSDRVPPVFLVDCAGGGTYRLVLSAYGGGTVGTGPTTPIDLPDTAPVTGVGNARPLTELATWYLPNANTATGSIAFDGRYLYYDTNFPGEIGVVRAVDGKRVALLHVDVPVLAMTVDLRRNQLLVVASGELVALDLRTLRETIIGQPPTRVPVYDSSTDGLSWFEHGGSSLWRRPRGGDSRGTMVCTVAMSDGSTSTFVAAGDGGGYVQDEDDKTLTRIDGSCRVKGTYQHRVFSESGGENDALACDTQSYFPQPAMWIRDSVPQTVTAYGVPFGYCPMPSLLELVAPAVTYAGSAVTLCADLSNRTNHEPAADRGVSIAVAGAVVGHEQTDRNGRVCLPWVAPSGFTGRLDLPVVATFAGDSALYPSTARASLRVLASAPAPPPPPRPLAVVPPPPPPPVPAIPPNPAPNPGPAGAPNPAPAPNAAQAPQGQMQAQAQPVAQGVVVPQRQQQPQLALARAASQIDTGNAMVAPARGRRRGLDPPVAAGALALGCVATAFAARAAAARAPARVVPRGTRRLS